MANLSNINNILRTGSLGVGINRDPLGAFEISSATKPGVKMFNTASGGKTYEAYSDTNGNYIIYDQDADSNRLTISSAGNATFAGDVDVTGSVIARANANYYSTRTYLGETWEFASDTGDGVTFKITGGAANTTGNFFKFQTQAGGATAATALTINKDLSATFTGTVKGTIAMFDTLNNNANSANIIYRSGTQTIIGGGTSTQKLKIEDNGTATFQGEVNVPSGKISILGGNNLTISGTAADHAGLSFGTNIIFPATAAGTNDNTFDLGDPDERFKDLYLGGTVTSTAFVGANVQLSNYIQLTVDDAEIYWANTANNNYWRWRRDASNNFICDHYNGSATASIMEFNSDGQIQFNRTGQPPITNSLYGNIVLKTDAAANYQRIRYDVGTTPYWGLTKLATSNNFAITGRIGSTWNDHVIEIAQATGNVGIGGAPTNTFSIKNGSNANFEAGCNSDSIFIQSYNRTTSAWAGISFLTNSETMRLTADGVLQLTQSSGADGFLNTDGTNLEIDINRNPATGAISDSSKGCARIQLRAEDGGAGSRIIFGTNSVNNATAIERMRIDKSGQVMIRRTADYSTDKYLLQVGDASLDDCIPAVFTVASTSARNQIVFSNFNSNLVGTIITSGSATSYNTSSDYRLKEDLEDFNGLEKVSNIKVYDFKWKDNENYEEHSKRGYGVLAHELEEVLPQAVNGEKDAINEDGTINPQGVDYSKIVPILLKAIQELKAEIEILKRLGE